MNKKAVFLDRDGILNKVIIRGDVVSSPWTLDEFEIMEEAKELVDFLKKENFLLFVVSNQPDISRGNLSESKLEAMNEIIRSEFRINEITCCTSGDDTCYRRKPNPGMILDFAERFDVVLNQSYIVGDGKKDILAGKAAGVNTILLQTRYNESVHGLADYNCNNFDEIRKCFVN